MTISSQTRKAGPYIGNGSQTAFPFTFKVFSASDLLVVQTDLSLVDTTLTLTTNYTVSLNTDQNSNPGGTVNMLVAPPANYKLTLSSQVSPLQTVDLTNQGGFYPNVISTALDKLTILVQQLTEQASRSIKASISTTVASFTLPAPSANTVIGWNSTATELVNVDEATLGGTLAAEYTYSQTFNGTGSQTVFTLSSAPGALSNTDVYISGVHQLPTTHYTLSGTTVTFTTAPAAGTNNIQVKWNTAVGTSGVQAYATAAASSAASALTYLQTFQGQYYGAAASDPATDPFGAACTTGDLYWSTTAQQMKVYNGTAWTSIPGQVRTTTIADATSITMNADTTDVAVQVNTQVAGTLTINAPTGTPINGQKLILRLQATNLQTFSWNAAFAGSTDLALPTASSSGAKYDYIGFAYNSTAGKWQMIAKMFGF